MPAVVRVKRRVDEEPLSAFILNGKKRRLESGISVEGDTFAQTNFKESEDVSTILTFAGTIKQQDDNVTSRFARLNKEEAKELVLQKSRRLSNLTDRIRQQTRKSMQENRFRIVNCMRTTLNLAETKNKNDINNVVAYTNIASNNLSGKKQVTIVDIEKQGVINNLGNGPSTSTCLNFVGGEQNNFVPTAVPDNNYVYDIYLPENEQQAENVDLMDNHLSVRTLEDIIYEDQFNNDEPDNHDSEDSNEENYYTNDYPDEVECEDGVYNENWYEEDIRNAIQRFNFDEDDLNVPTYEEDTESFNENSPRVYSNSYLNNSFEEQYEDYTADSSREETDNGDHDNIIK